jgi:hypothetical protein
MKLGFRATFGLVLALAAFSTADVQAQACEDVSGDWAVALTFPGAPPQEVTVTLEQSDCEVTGLIKGNNETPIEDGTVDGWTFSFKTTVNAEGGQVVVMAWEGTVDGDDLAGNLTADAVGTVSFTGKRAE